MFAWMNWLVYFNSMIIFYTPLEDLVLIFHGCCGSKPEATAALQKMLPSPKLVVQRHGDALSAALLIEWSGPIASEK